MSTHQSSNNADGIDEEGLLRDVDVALTSLGWKVPQSQAEVSQAEESLPEILDPAGLPEALRDPRAILSRRRSNEDVPAVVLPCEADRQIEEDLARAAREGGRIPPELEEILRRDRQAAEREAEDGKAGT